MTGMPSLGEFHDDEAIWNIAAFAVRLPAMTAAEYESYPAPQQAGHTN